MFAVVKAGGRGYTSAKIGTEGYVLW